MRIPTVRTYVETSVTSMVPIAVLRVNCYAPTSQVKHFLYYKRDFVKVHNVGVDWIVDIVAGAWIIIRPVTLQLRIDDRDSDNFPWLSLPLLKNYHTFIPRNVRAFHIPNITRFELLPNRQHQSHIISSLACQATRNGHMKKVDWGPSH